MINLIKPNTDVIINSYNTELNVLRYDKYKQAIALLQSDNVITTDNKVYTILTHSCIKTLCNPNDIDLRLSVAEKTIQELDALLIPDALELYLHIEEILNTTIDLITNYGYTTPIPPLRLDSTTEFKLSNNSKIDKEKNNIITIILLHIIKGMSTNPLIVVQKSILTNKEYYIWLASYIGLIPPIEFSTHHWVALET